MKSMQRTFGKFTKRQENEADVQMVMEEFKAVDNMLERLIKDVKAWQQAWEDVLKYQYDASEAFADLYKSIEPTDSPEQHHRPQETPAKYMQKCLGLQKEYSDEKTDLAQEIAMISTKCLKPAEEAKQHTKLLQKTLKHRENMKLDYERYLSRAEHLRKKDQRTAKDETALAAHEANLAQAQISYQTADEQVKQTFPPVNEAIMSLLPYILANQVMLQTTLVGQLYTVLDAYTRKFGFPNPAPSNTEIVSVWDGEFSSLRREVETGLATISNGKAVHLAMDLPDKKEGTITGLGIRNKSMGLVNRNKDKPVAPVASRPTIGSRISSNSYQQQEAEELAPPKPPRPGVSSSPSFNAPIPMPSPSLHQPSPNLASKPRISSFSGNGAYDRKPSPTPPPYGQTPSSLMPAIPTPSSGFTSSGATPPSRYQTPLNGAITPSGLTSPPAADYFGQRRTSAASSIASSAASMAAAKKKPPPPVPAKRIPSQPVQYVTALFDFEGQNVGDLSFVEGDRIRVVKKTESTDDWWDGELKGRTGAFPANYVQL